MEGKNKVAIIGDKDSHLASLLSPIKDDIDIYQVKKIGIRNTVSLLSKITPDLIIIRLSSRNRRNVLLCRELKRQKTTQDIPVVFIAGGCGAQDTVEKTAYVYGCIDVLSEKEDAIRLTQKLQYYSSLGKIERGLKSILARLDKGGKDVRLD